MSNPTLDDLRALCASLRDDVFMTNALIIAGGAPRDILSGVEVKDVDVFVQLPQVLTPNQQENFLGELTDDATIGDATRSALFIEQCERVRAMYKGRVCEFVEGAEEYGGLVDLCTIPGTVHGTLQLVALDHDPVDDVHRYDYSLSQVLVTPGGVFQSLHCANDRAGRRVTFTGSVEHDSHAALVRSWRRLQRLQAKYTALGWTFHDCERLVLYIAAHGTEAQPKGVGFDTTEGDDNV